MCYIPLSNTRMNVDDHVRLLFPIPLYHHHISLSDDYRQSLIEFIRRDLETIEECPDPFYSKTNYFEKKRIDHPIFEELVHQIEHHIQKYCQISNIRFEQLNDTSMWYSISKYGQQHMMHDHNNSVVSGVFYLQIPKDKTLYLTFQNRDVHTLAHLHDSTKTSFSTYQTHHEELKTGLILLFPGHVFHGFGPNPSQQEKIAIAFNYGFIKH